MDQVTFVPILAAGIASVVLAYVWYHPSVFGGMWMRLANFSPEMIARANKRMPWVLLVLLLANLYIAWTMDAIGVAFAVWDWVSAIVNLSLSLWLGFALPVLLCVMLLDQRSWKLIAIHAGYWFVAFSIMALTLFGLASVATEYPVDNSSLDTAAYPLE